MFSLCLLDKGSVLTPPKNAPLKAVAVLKMCANCSKDICSNAPKYWVYCLEKYTLYNHTIASPVTLAIRIFTSLYDIYVWALKLFFYKCPNYHQLISSCLHKKRELSHLLTHVYPCTQMHVLTMHTLGLDDHKSAYSCASTSTQYARMYKLSQITCRQIMPYINMWPHAVDFFDEL